MDLENQGIIETKINKQIFETNKMELIISLKKSLLPLRASKRCIVSEQHVALAPIIMKKKKPKMLNLVVKPITHHTSNNILSVGTFLNCCIFFPIWDSIG